MKRILVIGCCGAGKTTLARELGQKWNLPVHHLDRLWWLPGWVEDSPEHFDAKLAAILQTESWIIDGNYNRTLPDRLKYADTVIWLDYPRRTCIWRTLKRIFSHRGSTRPDMTDGCPERFDWKFLRYVWHFNRDMRPQIEAALFRFGGKCVRFKAPWQTKIFLQNILNGTEQ